MDFALSEEQTAVRDLAISHHGSRTGFVTVSIGVAGFAGDGTAGSVETLVDEADAALYAAKAAGRDRTIMSGPS